MYIDEKGHLVTEEWDNQFRLPYICFRCGEICESYRDSWKGTVVFSCPNCGHEVVVSYSFLIYNNYEVNFDRNSFWNECVVAKAGRLRKSEYTEQLHKTYPKIDNVNIIDSKEELLKCPICGKLPALNNGFIYGGSYSESSLYVDWYSCTSWFGLKKHLVADKVYTAKGYGTFGWKSRATKKWNEKVKEMLVKL